MAELPNPKKQWRLAADLLEPADYGEFLLHDRNEIAYVLRLLLEHKNQIAFFFNKGNDLILSTLIAIQGKGLIFDYGPNKELNERVLTVDKLFCTTLLDGVTVQFILRGLQAITHEGRLAFLAALPDDLLRLQRREFYRLTMPISLRLICEMPMPSSGDMIEVDVIDISGGGMAMLVPPEGVLFEPGMEIHNCRIELPDTGVITSTIRVCSLFEITLRNGHRVKRSGCQFIGMPGTMTNLIQRYINKIDRERKARETGLL